MTSFLDKIGAHGSAAATKANKKKPPPKRTVVSDKAVARAVRTVGTTTKREAPMVTRTVKRTVARSPAPSSGGGLFNLASPSASPTSGQARSKIQTGGLSDLQALLAASPSNGGSTWVGGLVKNAARGGLNMITSVPSIAQLSAENVAAFGSNPVSASSAIGGSLLQRAGIGGGPHLNTLQKRVAREDKAAAQATAADYSYRYGPLLHGDLRTTGQRVYNDPLSYAMDASMLKAGIGHGLNIPERVIARAAPGTEMAARARRSMSGLPAADRAQVAALNNEMLVAKGKRTLPFAEGPGGLRRPPRTVRSTIANPEPGKPVLGERVIQVERSPYSADRIARARQKLTDSAAARVGPKVSALADRVQIKPGEEPTLRRGISSSLTAPFRTESKYARFQRKNARQLGDVKTSQAEALAARNIVGAKGDVGLGRALIRLRKDQTLAGIPEKQKLSTEQAAVRLHLNDELSARGGKTPSELRDMIVRRAEGENARRLKAGKNTAEERAQIEIVKRIPDKLLNLTDLKDPAVKRVADAMAEGRRVDPLNQAQSVAAGVVTEGTSAAMGARSSAISLGGSQWWQDAVRKVQSDYADRMRPGVDPQEIADLRKARNVARSKGNGDLVAKLDKQIRDKYRPGKLTVVRKRSDAARVAAQEARAAGDTALAGKHYAQARKLDATLKNMIVERQARIAKIKQGATTESPQLAEARTAFTEANTRMSEAAQVGSAKEIQAATRSRDTYMKRLRKQEAAHLGLTAPRRPELIGDRGVYIADKRLRPGERPTGARTQKLGPDRAVQSQGRLKARLGYDMNPNLMLHQTARAAQNYTGKMSGPALNELMSTIEYHVPGKFKDDGSPLPLTGDKKGLEAAVASGRVGFVRVGRLKEALKTLDTLPKGKWIDKQQIADIFSDHIPEGAKASDYVAVHKDGMDVWKETMGSPGKVLQAMDNALTFWKGGLLALSPRWYINNTFGLALQYGLLAPGDVSSVIRGNRPEIRAAMEARAPWLARDTLAHELQGSTKLPGIMQKGFAANAHLEEIWRRAAYYNRAKRLLGTEGVRYSRLTDAEMARALEHMPDSMVRQIGRDVEYFIGDYRKFNKFERNVVKRVVPFYSWLRVISKITFGLPFRSPTRAYLIMVLGKAATAGINPNDYQLPWYNRGAIRVGDMAINTSSMNPAQTVGGFVAALGAKSPARALSQEGIGFAHPAVGLINSLANGTNSFGQAVSPAPGAAAYGQDPRYLNPVTQTVESQPAGMPWQEAILQTIVPGQVSIARKVLSDGLTPLDTTSTLEIIRDWVNRQSGGKGNDKLYRTPPKTPQGRTLTTAGRYTGPTLGLPIYRQNDAVLNQKAQQDLRKLQALQRQLAAKR